MNFMEIFQKDEPLHVLCLKLEELLEKLTRHVCKNPSGKKFNQLLEAHNILLMREIAIPKVVKVEL